MTNLLQANDAVWVTKHQADEGACWGEVILNRPERKNAIVGPLGLGLAEGIARLDADADVQAIVLRGAGGSFLFGFGSSSVQRYPRTRVAAGFSTNLARRPPRAI